MGVNTDGTLHGRQGTSGTASGRGMLFGIPIGDLGWFASLLMGTATAFAAFFAATFVGIVYIMFHNTPGREAIDYSYSYMRLGLPVGITVFVIAFGYLGTLWVRRILRRA